MVAENFAKMVKTDAELCLKQFSIFEVQSQLVNST